MAQSSAESTLARLSQGTTPGHLKEQVRHLTKPRFVELLELIIQEFEYFLKAISLIHNQSLEVLLEELLEAFTLKIGQILNADRTTIFMVDEENKELWSRIGQNEMETAFESRIPINKGIAGYVATSKKTVNIPNAYDDPRFNRATDEETGYRTKNILCMPIFSNDVTVVAVVRLLNKIGGDRFTFEDEKEFESFARSIGVLLESCNSFYTAALTQKGLNALLNAISSMEQSLDLEVTLQSLMAEASKLMQADRSTLWLIDGDELWSRVPSADGTELIELRQVNAKDSIVGYVASTGETLNIPNAYKDIRFDSSADDRTGYRTQSILCMPVFNSTGKVMGVTQLITKNQGSRTKNQGSFTRSDESFMRAFNTQVGIALENAQLYNNVLLEKQYQKDILQSLSDAVISTNMDGQIVSINEAALGLLGCPTDVSNISSEISLEKVQNAWEEKLKGRSLWEVVPIENLRSRLSDCLEFGTQHYVPEQTLQVAIATIEGQQTLLVPTEIRQKLSAFTSQKTIDTGQTYYLWGLRTEASYTFEKVDRIERSINLTLNPLTEPDGDVRGGLVVLGDISQEKRMKTTLYRYMTPSVAEQVMALGEDSLMVNKRRDVTVLYSYIWDYVALTESLEAPQVLSMLNEYFETMVEAVFNHDGTLDKFIGNAFMAVFGAPLPLENHGWSALQTALDMRKRLILLNESRREKQQPEMKIGIGLSSGEVVSGNIGSHRKMEYTVVGECVELAQKLRDSTPYYDCDILLSNYTLRMCQDLVETRELDWIRYGNYRDPIKVYELIDTKEMPLSSSRKKLRLLYEAGKEQYMQSNFADAINFFEAAQQICLDDKPTSILLTRAKESLRDRPNEDWQPIHTL